MKTQSVKFSFDTVKDASLKVPVGPCSIHDIVVLICQSYLEWAFYPGCSLMSDEMLVSSIGHSNFFAGALGGYKERVSPEVYKHIEELAKRAS